MTQVRARNCESNRTINFIIDDPDRGSLIVIRPEDAASHARARSRPITCNVRSSAGRSREVGRAAQWQLEAGPVTRTRAPKHPQRGTCCAATYIRRHASHSGRRESAYRYRGALQPVTATELDYSFAFHTQGSMSLGSVTETLLEKERAGGTAAAVLAQEVYHGHITARALPLARCMDARDVRRMQRSFADGRTHRSVHDRRWNSGITTHDDIRGDAGDLQRGNAEQHGGLDLARATLCDGGWWSFRTSARGERRACRLSPRNAASGRVGRDNAQRHGRLGDERRSGRGTDEHRRWKLHRFDDGERQCVR